MTTLTPRQQQVLRCAMNGDSMDDTGTVLFITRDTVRTHREAILRKLEARNITHAVAIAMRGGLLR